MKQGTTLTEFIDQQVTNFKIEPTKKNLAKIRRKLMRELEKLELWDSASTKKDGRNITRVFSHSELEQLYVNTENYFLKIGNIDSDSFLSNKEKLIQLQEAKYEYHDPSEHNYEEELKISKLKPWDIQDFMIKALFEKFFEPIDFEQWDSDRQLLLNADNFDLDSTNPIAPQIYEAMERLENPTKYYTREK